MSQSILLNLPDDLADRARGAAITEGTNLTSFIRQSIEYTIRQLEFQRQQQYPSIPPRRKRDDRVRGLWGTVD